MWKDGLAYTICIGIVWETVHVWGHWYSNGN